MTPEKLDGFLELLGSDTPRALRNTGSGKTAVDLQLGAHEWARVERAAAAFGLEPVSFREKCDFSSAEHGAAALFAVIVRRAPPFSPGAPGGVQYDYSITPNESNPAPWCWQAGPLLMKKADLPKPEIGLCATVPGEILVSRELSARLSSLASDDVHFLPVYDARTLAPLEWNQVAAARAMPPYDDATTGVIEADAQPHNTSHRAVFDSTREGYMPVIARGAVEGVYGGRLPKTAFTNELYGQWASEPETLWGPPQPRLIVSAEVRDLLESVPVRKLEYVPVKLVE